MPARAARHDFGSGSQYHQIMQPIEIVLEFVRKEAAGDPFGFHFTPQEYLLRSAGGSFESALLPWDQSLLSDLRAVRLPGCDPVIPQRLGELLRTFVTPLGWVQYDEKIRLAGQRGQQVLLTIRSAAAELYALPWELCTLKSSGQHIGELPGVLLRYEWPETRTEPEQPLPRRSSGRILFAWSAAGGAVPAVQHESAITRACQQAGQPFDGAQDCLENATGKRLAETLQAARSAGQPISVLHILCHGAGLGSSFGLVLNSTDDSEGPVLVDAGRLRQLLAPYASMVRLVVLMACDSSNSGELGSQLGSLAQTLHRAGVAAVVASRYPLSLVGSTLITEELYQALLGRLDTLEGALLAVRDRLLRDAPGRDWASVQLYARSQDGIATRPLEFRPYRGLLAFGPEHRRFFFGREREVAEIIADLAALAASGKPRFLVVAGASGTGKSSLVLAVAVPKLCQENQFQALIMRPGAAGLWRLEEACKERAAMRQPPPLLVVIDQFEEVFTRLVEDLRAEFIKILWAVASNPDSGISVIVTLRVDFLGHCGEAVLDSSGLRLDRIAYDESHRVFISQLGFAELRQAIEQPAALVGLTLEPGLCERMLADVSDQPGALPMLSYTLDLLWQRRQEQRLTQAAYTELGGVSGALEQEGEKLLGVMDDKQRLAARRLLVALVDLRQDLNGATRRRVKLADLQPADPSRAAEFASVLDRLVNARLLVRGEDGTIPVVEVAHEALIRKWKTLREWLQADREKLLALAKLRAWTAEWQSFPGALLRDDQLGYAREVQRAQGEDLDPGMHDLIIASEAALQQRSRAEHQRKRAALTSGLLVAAMLLGAGVLQWRELKREAGALRKAAEVEALATRLKAEHEVELFKQSEKLAEQRKILIEQRLNTTKALLMVAAAQSIVETQPKTAALLLIEADRAAGGEPEGGLQVALRALRYLLPPRELRDHQGPVRWVEFSPNGKLLVTASDDQTARVWPADEGGTAILLKGHHGPVVAARFSPDSRHIVTASADGTARVWSADGSGEPLVLKGHHGALAGVAFNATSELVVTASHDHTARVWRVDGSAPPAILAGHTGPVLSAEFSPAGLILTTSTDRTARVWALSDQEKVPQWEEVTQLPQQQAAPVAKFSPNGQWIVTASTKKPACLWANWGSGDEPETCLNGHTGGVISASFDPSGTHLVTASVDHTARVWNLSGGLHDAAHTSLTLKGHSGPVQSALFDRSGDHVLTVSQDETVRLWFIRGTGGAAVLLDGQGAVHAAVFSPSGARVATACADHTARVWQVTWTPIIAALRSGPGQRCLSVEHRLRYLAESGNDALNRYETCQRNHGRTP